MTAHPPPEASTDLVGDVAFPLGGAGLLADVDALALHAALRRILAAAERS